jgi:hypothetical protein
MPGGRIYLRDQDRLVPMVEAPYDAEDILQALLADYPDLLAGDQMRPDEPRRWLLITREAGIPDSEGGQPRWSLDHLFIDQDAIPTLVEVKRSSDTRLRREVVGQMLDYAANVVAHWPGAELRRLFEQRARSAEATADGEVLALLRHQVLDDDDVHAVDDFWDRAAANLAARKLRLVFVADIIPPELQRIIEFLNENLVRVEVLAVEVKQYVGEGRQTLVPRVIGRTAAAADVKQSPSGSASAAREWTEAEFLEAAATVGSDAERLARAAQMWTRRRGLEPILGKGKSGPIYFAAKDASGRVVKIANVNTAGGIQLGYDTLAKFPPFDRVEARIEANNRVNAIPGVQISERLAVDATWPGIKREVLAPEPALAAFLGVLDWIADEIAHGGRTAEKTDLQR